MNKYRVVLVDEDPADDREFEYTESRSEVFVEADDFVIKDTGTLIFNDKTDEGSTRRCFAVARESWLFVELLKPKGD